MDGMLEWITSLPEGLQEDIERVKEKAAVFTLVNEAPRGKERPRFTRAGRCYTSSATRKAEEIIRRAGQQQASLLTGPLGVLVLAVFPIPASWPGKKRLKAGAGLIRPAVKPDFDNVAKLYCDALNGVMWEDDKQIVDGRCIKVYGQQPGVLVVGWHLDQ